MIRVLVVEDHKEWLSILQEDLEMEGYQVTTASSLHEAMKHLQQTTFHVVVTDIGLTEDTTDIGGIRLLEWLKVNRTTSRALAISGRAVTGLDKEKFKEVYGVLEYIERIHFDSDEFVALVAKAAAASQQAMADTNEEG